MDAAIEGSSSTPPQAGAARTAVSPAVWRGHESPWVLAARAAAPWPIWWGLAIVGVPGASFVPALSHGILALALVLALMGLWTHRPNGRSGLKWLTAVVGTGLIGELLANALTDMGRSPGLGAASDGARGLTVWLIGVAVYELAPVLAATSRVARTERRSLPLDVVAHLGFLLAGLGAFAWEPTWGTAWYVSPWLAVAVALPLAAARSGPEREAELPAPHPRGGLLFGLGGLAWVALILVAVARARVIRGSFHDMRWGVDPVDGVLLALPAVSVVLSLFAAAALLVRARRVQKSAHGTIVDHGDRALLLGLDGREPTSVAIDQGPLPEIGATVTLIGAGTEPPGVGPFRDGAPQLRARRAWVGAPDALARAFRQRAAGWLLMSAFGALGVILRLL
ncbi:MAG: hypothetical protein R3B82_05685 [Sandaracinaceae bacterium]